MRIVNITVELRLPGEYTDEHIEELITECDYTFNYPVENEENEVREIDTEIIDYIIKI